MLFYKQKNNSFYVMVIIEQTQRIGESSDAESSERDRLLIDVEPPPSLSLYNAQYFLTTATHDPHLNTDGEVLYRLLVASLPTSKSASKARTQRPKPAMSTPSTRQSDTETVTDFDFGVLVYPQQIFGELMAKRVSTGGEKGS